MIRTAALHRVGFSWIARVGLVAIPFVATVHANAGPAQLQLLDSGPMPVWAPAPDCIPAAERANVSRRIRAWYASAGGSAAGGSWLAPQLYTFHPMGGRLYRDVFIYNFVDLDPGAGMLDWDCGIRTENGHLGIDTLIRSFEEQTLGVPVFAALDGTVVATDDGHPDTNLVCSGQPANYVVIDHGGGRLGSYWHLKRGSVAVSTGQIVRAGEQIGQVGSSGCSYYPHLHFEEQLGGNAVEPYAGPCRPGPSGWTQQTPIPYEFYLDDFGVTDTNPLAMGSGGYVPRSGQWAQSSQWIYFWCFMKNYPAYSTWRAVFVRPSGATAYDSGTVNFDNANGGRWYWANWGYWYPPMQSEAGTWTIRLWLNGVHRIDAPVVVVPSLIPGFNRAPEPISVAFVPAYPTPSDVVGCEVQSELLLDDLDWDILRYHYVWKVNGALVRDVVTAAHSDFLPRDSWSNGDVLSCDVTPNDGIADGATASVSSFVTREYCTAGTTSHGCVPAIAGLGTPSASSGSAFTILATAIEGQKQGLVFYGVDNAGFVPVAWGTSSSYLCVKSPAQRTPIQNSGGTTNACDGSLALDWNAFLAANPSALGAPFAAGSHVFSQAWYRDPPSPKTTALSNALEFVVGP